MRRPPVKDIRYAVCVDNGDGYYELDLIPRRIYEVWADRDGDAHGQLRIVDETGEDYLFPVEYFRILTLPPGVDRLIRAASRAPERRRRAASKARR
jgi:hypothetical protein